MASGPRFWEQDVYIQIRMRNPSLDWIITKSCLLATRHCVVSVATLMALIVAEMATISPNPSLPQATVTLLGDVSVNAVVIGMD